MVVFTLVVALCMTIPGAFVRVQSVVLLVLAIFSLQTTEIWSIFPSPLLSSNDAPVITGATLSTLDFVIPARLFQARSFTKVPA